MEREEKFLDYCNKYADKGYVSANVPRILENLEKAWNARLCHDRADSSHFCLHWIVPLLLV